MQAIEYYSAESRFDREVLDDTYTEYRSNRAFEPGTAQAQKRPQTRSLKLWRGGFCAVLFAQ
eukprot:14195879-Alexandrium_andersonii.AAC.1